MKIPGFPDEDEMLSMMGYVTDEDRAKWRSMKEASDQRMADKGSKLTARELAQQTVSPAVGLAERGIQSQMIGAQTAEEKAGRDARKVRTTQTTTRTRVFEEDVSDSADGPELG